MKNTLKLIITEIILYRDPSKGIENVEVCD